MFLSKFVLVFVPFLSFIVWVFLFLFSFNLNSNSISNFSFEAGKFPSFESYIYRLMESFFEWIGFVKFEIPFLFFG